MASIPTYILAPNFTYHLNTSICMGDIVQYPDDPTKPLSSVPESELKPITRHYDYENEHGNQHELSLRGGVWENFLKKASTKISGGSSDELLTKYTIQRLETIYFTKQPTDEEAQERIKHKKVKAAIDAGFLGKKPVFMITGLKVARGFRLSSSARSTTDANVKIEASVTPDAGMGAEAEYARKKFAEQKHRAGQDIIFAYQLHIITQNGWPWAQKDVDISVYRAPAALLSDDEGDEDADLPHIEVHIATEAALRNFNEELQMEAIIANNGEEDCVCIIFNEY
ncbi:hypothetical protein F4802DRAFT_443647 [Xylaria palmicola]|nr:hypothetical protein F4802DRAFT_443647 [Xylaria palmicola]